MKTRIIVGTGIGTVVLLFVFFIPITTFSIDGFDGTLETNTPIPFSVQQIGCGVSCKEFTIQFIRDDGHTFWTYGGSSLDDPFEEYPKLLFQRNAEPHPLVIEYPGEYTIKVSSDDYSIEKKFTVNLLEGMLEYDGIDYYQYVQIQEWLGSCRQSDLTNEQCDSEVRKQIVYANQTQFEKLYFTVRIPEICLYLNLICPGNYAFPGIEKDGYIIVEYSHKWDDEYYEFVIENNSIKSVWYSGDNFER